MTRINIDEPTSELARLRKVNWRALAPEVTGKFQLWLNTARPGAVFAYHHGMLCCDRGVEGKPREGVDAMARMAWGAHEVGAVELVQMRRGRGYYSYLAVKRRRVRRRGQ